MNRAKPEWRLRLLQALCAGALLAVAGCGGFKVVPVSGKATLDGGPLTHGAVSFNPDPAKGNTARASCTGRLTGDGQYELYTDDGHRVVKGAPPGWYKVTALFPGEDKPPPLNKKYLDFAKTDLSVEVVENPEPGRYDLKFTK
jgi:hypothetical protein